MIDKEIFLMTEKTAGKDGRRIVAAVSSEAIDRDDEIVSAAAIKAAMPEFMKNPVILAAHTHRLSDGTPSVIGKVIRWWQEGKKTYAEIEFADTPLGKQYQTLYAEKYQRAFSIGFRPIKHEQRNINGKSIVVHTEIELYEISAVAVPANPEALSKHAKSRLEFVQAKKEQKTEIDDPGWDLFYGPTFPSRAEFDDYKSGKAVNLSQDELIVMKYLEKQGFEFAEALFSLPDDFGTEFEDEYKDMDDDEFFDPEASEADCEPDYAAIFKR